MLQKRSIVAPTNEAANEIDDFILDTAFEEAKIIELVSCDSIQGGDASEEHYPVEFLNSIETRGLPPHKLRLAKGAVLMAIRNYAPHLGVCAGTRAMVREAGRRCLKVVMLTHPQRGK